jgi:hypothetical protein
MRMDQLVEANRPAALQGFPARRSSRTVNVRAPEAHTISQTPATSKDPLAETCCLALFASPGTLLMSDVTREESRHQWNDFADVARVWTTVPYNCGKP